MEHEGGLSVVSRLRLSLMAGTLLSAAAMVPAASAQDSFKSYIQPAVHVQPLEVRGRTAAQGNGELNGVSEGMSEDVVQSVSCVVTGTAATAAAIAAGGENLVNVIAGGAVAPANRAILYIGLVGVVFASFCQIGQALTPLLLYLMDPVQPPLHDQPVNHRKANTELVPAGAMRVAHTAGVLAPAAKLPPLRAAMAAQPAPGGRVLASVNGIPSLTSAFR